MSSALARERGGRSQLPSTVPCIFHQQCPASSINSALHLPSTVPCIFHQQCPASSINSALRSAHTGCRPLPPQSCLCARLRPHRRRPRMQGGDASSSVPASVELMGLGVTLTLTLTLTLMGLGVTRDSTHPQSRSCRANARGAGLSASPKSAPALRRPAASCRISALPR
jgi:hypothetical protein